MSRIYYITAKVLLVGELLVYILMNWVKLLRYRLELLRCALVIEEEDTAITQARELINRTQQDISNQVQRRKLLELIETILFYKLPTMSRKEIEAMFGLSELKQTKIYQEAQEETKLESIPRFLAMGLTPEQIAQGLDLSVEVVIRVATQGNPNLDDNQTS